MDAQDVKTTNGSSSDLGDEETSNHSHVELEDDEIQNSPTKNMGDLKISNCSSPGDAKTTSLSSLEPGELQTNHTTPEPNDTVTRHFSLEAADVRTNHFSPEPNDSRTSRFTMEAGDARMNRFSPELNRMRTSRFAPESDDSTKPAEVKKTNRFNVESGDFKALSRYNTEPSSPQSTTQSVNEVDDGRRQNHLNFELGNVITEDVLCDSCIEGKKKAVRSCLVCQTSFCDVHLKPHLEGAAFRDHKLLDPIRDFEARKCQLHSKTMELFCQTDQTCICYLCMFQEHKNHNTVTVEAEKYVKEAELSEIQEQLHLQILDVGDEEEKWQKEKDRIKNYTTNQKAAVDHSFKDLINELQRQRDEVMIGLDQKERGAMENIEHIVNELEGKREQLSMRQHDGAKLLLTTDAVLFLQEFQTVIRNAPPIPPLPTYTVVLEGEKLTQSMACLREDLTGVCRKHVEKICKTDLSRNLIEKNNADNRYMVKDYTADWNQPAEGYRRFTSLLSGTGGNRASFQPSAPGRTLTESSPQSLNSIYGTKSRTFTDGSPTSLSGIYGTQGTYNVRQWDQPLEDTSGQGSSVYSAQGGIPSPYQYQNLGQAAMEASKQSDSVYNMNAYPMITRHQSGKPQTQTWKSSKQSLLSHQRPFYVNKGKAANSTDPQ